APARAAAIVPQTIGGSIMWWPSMFKTIRPRNNRRASAPRKRPASLRPNVEQLEFRDTPSISFHVSSQFPVSGYPYQTEVADFNNDGIQDLASIQNGNGVGIRLGHGDGTFADAVLTSAGTAVSGFAAGDFDGDGLLDLAAADFGNSTIYVLRGNGNGS